MQNAVQALVISRLVYGYVLLYGTSLSLVSRLQRIEICEVTRPQMREHLTGAFLELHWLLAEVQIVVQFSVLHIQNNVPQ